MLMPIIGYVTAGVNFSTLAVTPIEGVEIKYGLFLNAIVQFVLTAVALFFLIKAINIVRQPRPAAPPQPTPSEVYLKEIRDALVKGNSAWRWAGRLAAAFRGRPGVCYMRCRARA